jgi:hypothetical protein
MPPITEKTVRLVVSMEATLDREAGFMRPACRFRAAPKWDHKGVARFLVAGFYTTDLP